MGGKAPLVVVLASCLTDGLQDTFGTEGRQRKAAREKPFQPGKKFKLHGIGDPEKSPDGCQDCLHLDSILSFSRNESLSRPRFDRDGSPLTGSPAASAMRSAGGSRARELS